MQSGVGLETIEPGLNKVFINVQIHPKTQKTTLEFSGGLSPVFFESDGESREVAVGPIGGHEVGVLVKAREEIDGQIDDELVVDLLALDVEDLGELARGVCFGQKLPKGIFQLIGEGGNF